MWEIMRLDWQRFSPLLPCWGSAAALKPRRQRLRLWTPAFRGAALNAVAPFPIWPERKVWLLKIPLPPRVIHVGQNPIHAFHDEIAGKPEILNVAVPEKRRKNGLAAVVVPDAVCGIDIAIGEPGPVA